MDRLQDGCSRLGIPAPDSSALLRDANQLLQGVDRAVLKVLVTRGQGGRGYRPPDAPTSRRIVSVHDSPDYPDSAWTDGVRVRWCETRLASNPRLAGIKHCNRLEQVLARAEWGDPHIAEGLMCDGHGRVIEGTMSNLFVYRDGGLLTSTLDRCGVAGVARNQLIALAEDLGIPVRVGEVSRSQVLDADALLLTNALIGAWSVCDLAGRQYPASGWPKELIARIVERCHQP